jgi:hypothetical protein
MKYSFSRRILMMTASVAFLLCGLGQLTKVSAAPVTGAIFTTNVNCTGTDLNIYDSKAAVYVDGGPAHPGAAGLPNGLYYVQVTTPGGTLLGTTVGTTNETPVSVVNGDFQACYQLSAILRKGSDAGPFPVAPDGYDDTTNPGGEYKVWISTDSTFTNSQTKTDNFKVKTPEECTENCGPQEETTLTVRKYYDANANGQLDAGEVFLAGWRFNIHDGINLNRYTPITLVVAPDTYTVTEYMPNETNWINTDPGAGTLAKSTTLASGNSRTLNFGNVCLGPGGGLTLGFWSNKNGQKQFGSDDLALMVSLNLRNANGTAFNPGDYTTFRTWLLSANATNMAYMLSAQLAAMELNVLNGNVTGSSIVYVPGLPGYPTGFLTVNQLMTAADTELGLHGNTTSGTPGDVSRAYQEALKNGLDRGNNNLNFVQATACPYTFTE